MFPASASPSPPWDRCSGADIAAGCRRCGVLLTAMLRSPQPTPQDVVSHCPAVPVRPLFLTSIFLSAHLFPNFRPKLCAFLGIFFLRAIFVACFTRCTTPRKRNFPLIASSRHRGEWALLCWDSWVWTKVPLAKSWGAGILHPPSPTPQGPKSPGSCILQVPYPESHLRVPHPQLWRPGHRDSQAKLQPSSISHGVN